MKLSRIAIYCDNENESAALRYVLANRLPVKVRWARWRNELMPVLRRNQMSSGYNDIRCLVFVLNSSFPAAITKARKLLDDIDARFPGVAVVLLDMKDSLGIEASADIRLPGLQPMASIIDAVQNALAGNRGPRGQHVNVGPVNPQAKLSEGEVREIKARLRRGVKPQVIAELYDVSLTCIKGIADGATWANVAA